MSELPQPPFDASTGRLDMGLLLAPFYLRETTFAGIAERTGKKKVRTEYTIPDYQCGSDKIRLVRGAISREGNVIRNAFPATTDHTFGHFIVPMDEEGNLLTVVPGYMVMGGLEGTGGENGMILTGFESVDFSDIAIPGDRIVAQVGKDREGLVTATGRVHTEASGLVFAERPYGNDPLEFPRHAIYEMAAQKVGGAIFLLHPPKDADVVPIFMGMRYARVSPDPIRAGDKITGEIELTVADSIACNLAVALYNNGREHTVIEDVILAFAPKQKIIDTVRERKIQLGQIAA